MFEGSKILRILTMFEGFRGDKLPYKNKEDLPTQVKENLPEHAQEIYLKAFNNAWDQYKEPKERRGK